MGDPRRCLIDVSSAGFTPAGDILPPDLSPRQELSEFERAQVRRIAGTGADLASDTVLWHRDGEFYRLQDLELRLTHGLSVAAIGAVIMQILSWVRLLEPEEIGPQTLHSARDIIDGPDPEVDLNNFDSEARELLHRALALKDKARHVSRLW